MLKINEIFFSVQGESTRVGVPTIFIRTSGCHLRCTYCDTTYAYYDGKKMSNNDIVEEIKKHPTRYICLTGGEPLLQEASLDLMKQLCDLGYFVSLETSGDLSCKNVDPRVLKVIDIKTPDSGAPDKFNFENLNLTDVNSEFKFVICSEKDFDWSVAFVNEYRLNEKYTVLFSPSHAVISPKWLAEKILQTNLNVRLQLQLHKYIWSADTRGV